MAKIALVLQKEDHTLQMSTSPLRSTMHSM